MAEAKLIIDGNERFISNGVTPLGRTSDNFIAFPEDSNVSRYHAEIETRDEDFYLIDLNSSNGTTVNGEKITGEKLLKNGDEIVLGGSSRIKFLLEKKRRDETSAAENLSVVGSSGNAAADSETDEFQEKEAAGIAEETEAASKSSMILNVAGAAVGLAVVCVFAAGVYYFTKSPAPCKARAVIVQPETGDVIRKETEIKVKTENTDCASRAIFVLDDMIIASSDATSYDASINPSEFPELADGANHALRVVFEDEEGNPVGQPDEVLLAFETLATPTPDEAPSDEEETPRPTPQKKEEISLIDTSDMAKRFISQFPGQNYRFDKRFLQEVQKRTTEYKTEGYFTKAQQYRDVINEAYVKENNLQPSLGFLLAMSRSKFVPQKQGSNEGLWQMSNEFVESNKYNGTCENKDLSETTQKCAAISSAAYMKSLISNIFEGDVVYSVAAFEMSPLEASEWKAKLPQNRMDFWQNITDSKQREQVVRFFAAGIVAENPQRFGLKNDLPLSQLYPKIN